MAAKPKKSKTIDKWRKKKYFSVLAPKLFQERELGHAMAYDSTSLKGRLIKTNLMMITGNIKKQHVNITFKINKVQGDTAFTIVQQYDVSPSSIKRKIRRQRDRVDESFKCVTKDNKVLRMKPLLITRIKTSRSVLSALRKAAVQSIVDSVKKADYDALVMDIINERFQKNISNSLSKIVPVRFVDIRIMSYLGENDASSAEAPEENAKENADAEPEEKEEPQKKSRKPAKKEAVEPEAGEEKAVEKAAEKAETEELADETKPAEA